MIETQAGFLKLSKRPLLWFPRVIFYKREVEMAKYAIHTKWSWPEGVPSAETMQEWHREHRSNTKAEDIIWFKICLAPYIRPVNFGFSNKVSGTGGFMFNA